MGGALRPREEKRCGNWRQGRCSNPVPKDRNGLLEGLLGFRGVASVSRLVPRRMGTERSCHQMDSFETTRSNYQVFGNFFARPLWLLTNHVLYYHLNTLKKRFQKRFSWRFLTLSPAGCVPCRLPSRPLFRATQPSFVGGLISWIFAGPEKGGREFKALLQELDSPGLVGDLLHSIQPRLVKWSSTGITLLSTEQEQDSQQGVIG